MDTYVSKTANYEIIGNLFQGSENILTDAAVQFVCMLEEKFGHSEKLQIDRILLLSDKDSF